MSNAGASVTTCYGPVSSRVMEKAEKIRLLILDVDGVLSDGLIYMGNNGEELKAFNVRDGYGIRCALTTGIEVAIITGRKAKLVEDRCNTLGITHLWQGQSDKLIAYRELLNTLSLRPDEVAYVGDDLIDWPVDGRRRSERCRSRCASRCCHRVQTTSRALPEAVVPSVKCVIYCCWLRASWMKPKGNRYE